MKSRSVLREEIIKILYQVYIYEKNNLSYNIDNIIKDNYEQDNEFINDSVKGIIKNKKEIESIANKYLKDWDIDRLSLVDKAIISLGIYELKYTDTPNIICINEAIELAKKYSDEKVIKMINASLDAYYHSEIEEQ